MICGSQGEPLIGHLAEAVVAVAARVLLKVLLVVILAVVERSRFGDLGRDLAISPVGELGLVRNLGGFGGGELLGRGGVDGASVLRTDIISLTVQRGGVVIFPEGFEDLVEIDLVGVCLLYTSPSPRDQRGSRMPSSA